MKLKRDIAEGAIVSWDDVEYDANSDAVKVRREMERAFAMSAGREAVSVA